MKIECRTSGSSKARQQVGFEPRLIVTNTPVIFLCVPTFMVVEGPFDKSYLRMKYNSLGHVYTV